MAESSVDIRKNLPSVQGTVAPHIVSLVTGASGVVVIPHVVKGHRFGKGSISSNTLSEN